MYLVLPVMSVWEQRWQWGAPPIADYSAVQTTHDKAGTQTTLIAAQVLGAGRSLTGYVPSDVSGFLCVPGVACLICLICLGVKMVAMDPALKAGFDIHREFLSDRLVLTVFLGDQ